MLQREITREHRTLRRQAGFTLLEMLVGLAVMLVVVGVIMTAMFNMMQTQGTIQNRTEMHSNVRNATELLSQEIGQAGKISLPPVGGPGGACPLGQAALTTPVIANLAIAQPVGVCSSAGMFQGELLTIADNGPQTETVTLTVDPAGTNTITAIFTQPHLAGVPVVSRGAFASGIVPPAPGVPGGWPGYSYPGNPNLPVPIPANLLDTGSTGNVLKLYGDINGDGNLVYVEYTCDYTNNPGTLWRSVTPVIPGAVNLLASRVGLLNNLIPNPNGTPCFNYQAPRTGPTVGPDTYVVDVAVTLTVQTQNVDTQTGQFQQETKALLNIAPRNVVEAWELAGAGASNRIQPMPPNVAPLLLPPQ